MNTIEVTIYSHVTVAGAHSEMARETVVTAPDGRKRVFTRLLLSLGMPGSDGSSEKRGLACAECLALPEVADISFASGALRFRCEHAEHTSRCEPGDQHDRYCVCGETA